MPAVWMWLRTEARSRWRAWLSLALIFGIAAGAAIAAVAGGRRTATAYPRFVEAQDGFDAQTGGGGDHGYEERFAALKSHPMVDDYAELVILGGEFTFPAKPGRPEVVTNFPDLVLSGDPDGRALYETNRAKVLEGRLADPRSDDEVMIPFLVADRYRIEVGDRIVAGVGFDVEDFPAPLRRIPLLVVGIYAAPGEFEGLASPPFVSVPATPAIFETYRELVPPLGPDLWNLGLHLRGGSEAGARFKLVVERDFNLDVPILETTITGGIQKTIRLYAVALWLVGSLIAAATVMVLGQTLARQQLIEAADYAALRALGASRRQLAGLGIIRTTVIGLTAATLAALTAYLLSPLTPIGPARTAEPNPGFAFDATAVGLGAAIVFALCPLISLIPSLRAARSAARPDMHPIAPSTSSRIVGVATRRAGSPAIATGLRMALEPGRGRTAVPVRSTILAVALGVAALAASMVVGRSLSHLIETPALTGFTYDAILPDDDDDPSNNAGREQKLRSLPVVDRAVSGTLLSAGIGGKQVFLLGFHDGGDIGYAVIEGRAPLDAPASSLPEVALGPTTIRRLGTRIGATIQFEYPDPEQAEEEEETDGPIARRLRTQRARVVGVAAIPSFPFAAIEAGDGMIMSAAAIGRMNPLEQGGCCFVAFRRDVDLDEARKTLEEAGFEVFLRTTRADVATLEKISRLPIVLSAIFGALAATAMAHVLVTAVRRRRRDLAILKTLGFEKRQVRGAIAWQVSAVAGLAVLVGIPVGIALGRWGWRLIAAQFGVVPVSVAPAAFLALVLPAALVLGNLVAAIPGRIAARTQPALVLRAE